MNSEIYYNYLLRTNKLSFVYRKYFLYPRLNRWLSGPVLDFGCGIGEFLAFRPNTIGVDINPFVVKHCLKRGLKVYLISGFPLNFEKKTFQGVVLDNVVEHLEDPEPIIEEAARVLADAGTLIIGVPGKKGYARDPDHKRFYDETTLKNLIIPHGFEWLRTLHLPLRFPKIDRLLRQQCIYSIFKPAR